MHRHRDGLGETLAAPLLLDGTTENETAQQGASASPMPEHTPSFRHGYLEDHTLPQMADEPFGSGHAPISTSPALDPSDEQTPGSPCQQQ